MLYEVITLDEMTANKYQRALAGLAPEKPSVHRITSYNVCYTKLLRTGFGVLVPQIYANWVHEFENDQRTENFSFVDDSTNVQYSYNFV